jgi:hypothetical protein
MEPTQNSFKRSGAAHGLTTTVITPKVHPAASVPRMPSQIDTDVPRRPPPKTITKTPAIAPNRRRFRRGGVCPSTGRTLSSRSSLNEYPPLRAPRHVPLRAFVARCLVYTSPPGAYSPDCVEGKFCELELRMYGVLRSSPTHSCRQSHSLRSSLPTPKKARETRKMSEKAPTPSKFIADSSPLVMMWVNCCRESERR